MTSQKMEGKMKSSGFYGLDSSHENLNSCKFFKLLLASVASDIFSLAVLFSMKNLWYAEVRN